MNQLCLLATLRIWCPSKRARRWLTGKSSQRLCQRTLVDISFWKSSDPHLKKTGATQKIIADISDGETGDLHRKWQVAVNIFTVTARHYKSSTDEFIHFSQLPKNLHYKAGIRLIFVKTPLRANKSTDVCWVYLQPICPHVCVWFFFAFCHCAHLSRYNTCWTELRRVFWVMTWCVASLFCVISQLLIHVCVPNFWKRLNTFPRSAFALLLIHTLRADSNVHLSALLIHSSVCFFQLCLSPPQTLSNPVAYKL